MMQYTNKSLVVLLMVLVAELFAACTLETSDNGDLDGRWYLREVETIATGASEDVKEQRVFWSFQVRMANLRENVTYIDVFSRFEHSNGKLRLHDFYQNNHAKGDPPLTDTTAVILERVKVKSMDQTFKVEHLDSKTMVLSDDSVRYRFIKY